MTALPGGQGKQLPDELLHLGFSVSEPGCSLFLPPKQRPGGPRGSSHSPHPASMGHQTWKIWPLIVCKTHPFNWPTATPCSRLCLSVLHGSCDHLAGLLASTGPTGQLRGSSSLTNSCATQMPRCTSLALTNACAAMDSFDHLLI